MLPKITHQSNSAQVSSKQDVVGRLSEGFAQALDWWLHGLAIPWKRYSADPTIITFSGADANVDDAQDFSQVSELKLGPRGTLAVKSLEAHRLEKLARGASAESVYLYVQSDKVIVTKIDQAQRNLHALDIALESLPFARDEIFATQNDTQDKLYCVLKKDVDQLMKGIGAWRDENGNGLSAHFSGISFLGDRTWLYIDTHLPENSAAGVAYKRPAGRGWLFGLGVTLVVFMTVVLIATQYAQNQRVEIQAQLRLLEPQPSEEPRPSQEPQFFSASNSPSSSTLSNVDVYEALERSSSRSAERTLKVLNALLASLGPDVEVSQLILSSDELVIDASAESATRLQLALSNSAEFSGLEFVAGISTDAASNKERFRLKLDVSNTADDRGFELGGELNGELGEQAREGD